jgi:diaminopimelate epimerase
MQQHTIERKKMKLSFDKMHGTMNDFVVFDDLNRKISLTPGEISYLCNRRSGIGADGIIIVRDSQVADFFMDYINSDGSIAEMCGNGIRCLAKYVYDHELTDKRSLTIETRAGVKSVELYLSKKAKVESVRVDMGNPIFEAALIPTTYEPESVPIIDLPILMNDFIFKATLVSMGNPHCIIFLDEDIERHPQRFGPKIEIDPLFPMKTNVEFVRIFDEHSISMRVWERGSGETFSCGTGACASAVASVLKELTSSPIMVDLLGGKLIIEWSGIGTPVLMTGPAVSVFTGEISF